MKRKISYGIILLFVIVLFIVTNVKTTYIFVLPLLLLLPITWMLLHISARKASITLYLKGNSMEAGTVQMIVSVKNDSIIPLFRIDIRGALKNLLTKTEYTFSCDLSVPPKSTREYTMKFQCLHCGRIEGQLNKIQASDFLGIFQRNLQGTCEGIYYQYPAMVSVDLSEIERQGAEDVVRQNRYLHRRGNDVTEILQIRDYQKTDHIKTIHWKLSKKLGKKLVRELDMPSNQDVVLFMALSPENCDSGSWRNRVANTAATVSEELIAGQIFHDAVLFNEEGNLLGEYSIEGQITFDWYEKVLLDGDISFDIRFVEQYIHSRNVNEKYASVILITDKEECVAGFAGHNVICLPAV